MNTKTITLTLDGARPNNLPDLVKDAKWSLTIACAPIAGSNTLTSVAVEAWPGNITVGTFTPSGLNATGTVTADNTGWYTLEIAATLSSSEIFKGTCDVRIYDPQIVAVDMYPTGLIR